MYIYKNKLPEELTARYPVVVVHDVLSKVFSMMEKCSISSSEFRTFVSSRDYDDISTPDTESKGIPILFSIIEYSNLCHILTNPSCVQPTKI